MATHQIAQGIAQLGRNGDSTLVHMQPHEVAGLQAIAKANGTSLTINPETGLPEAFSLGGFFKSMLPTIAGAAVSMIPGMQPFGLSAMQSGILAGAATGALTNKKNPLMGAAMGGLGGYGGANLATAASKFNPAAMDMADDAARVAGIDKTIAAVNTPGMPVSPTADTLHAGAGQGFYGGTSGLFKGPTIESTGLTAGGYGAVEPTFGSNLSQAASNVAANPMGFIAQNKMPLATTLGGAALGGLEPSDLYGNTVNVDSSKGKYDPYASLNLNTDTGLKLYAQGGPVSFADGGMPDPVGLPGGGSEAMQGAGLLPLDVSDINAKYNIGEEGGFVPVPRLGLFADNDQIEAARTAYETQLASAMSGRGGMGSPFGYGGMGTMNRGGTDIFGRPTQDRGMGGMQKSNGGQNSMGIMTRTTGGSGIGATAPSAKTAETALARLNLNKNYANGGTIQSGGLQDLYGSQDAMTGPMLSREGYGLGRLQQLADGGVAGYAEGGETRYTLDKNTLGGRMFGDTGVIDKLPPAALAEILNNPGMRQFMGFRGVEEPKYYTASGMGGSGALSTTGPRVNLNTASGVGMAKGGYLDGPGDGMSDSIPATIEGKQPARLADGEFVVPADVVSHLGNGSTKAGSQRLYGMLDKVRKARTGTKKQGKQINPAKYMPA